MLSRATVTEENRAVGITSTVPGVYNGLDVWEEEGPGPESGGWGGDWNGMLALSEPDFTENKNRSLCHG